MSTNDITGDQLKSKPTTDAYRDNYERIFTIIANRDNSLEAARKRACLPASPSDTIDWTKEEDEAFERMDALLDADRIFKKPDPSETGQ